MNEVVVDHGEKGAIDKVKKVLIRYPEPKRDLLIPILQDIQEECGYLSEEAMIEVARFLGLPASKVYGVATFYNQFRFHPIGRYHIQVCRGTACHVKGSDKVLEALQHGLGIKAGETTKDGLFSIEIVACLGACGLAPVVAVNGEFHANMDPQGIELLIENLRKKAEDENGK